MAVPSEQLVKKHAEAPPVTRQPVLVPPHELFRGNVVRSSGEIHRLREVNGGLMEG